MKSLTPWLVFFTLYALAQLPTFAAYRTPLLVLGVLALVVFALLRIVVRQLRARRQRAEWFAQEDGCEIVSVERTKGEEYVYQRAGKRYQVSVDPGSDRYAARVFLDSVRDADSGHHTSRTEALPVVIRMLKYFVQLKKYPKVVLNFASGGPPDEAYLRAIDEQLQSIRVLRVGSENDKEEVWKLQPS